MKQHFASVVMAAVAVVDLRMHREREGDSKRSDRLHDAPLSALPAASKSRHRNLGVKLTDLSCMRPGVMLATRLGKKSGHELTTFVT